MPIVLIGATVVAGALFEFVLRGYRRRASDRELTAWTFALEALRGVVLLWSAAAGIFIAHVFFSLSPTEQRVADRSIAVLLIWSATIIAARLLVRLVERYVVSHQDVGRTTSLLMTVASFAVYATGTTVVLTYLGISITPILTALGVGGLAVALALRGTLANFFSGLQLVASRRIRVGDFVRLDGEREGVVHDITWLHTTIRQANNSLVIVPNEKLAESAFTNLSLPGERTSVSASVNLAYGNDLSLVETVTLDVAVSVEAEFAPDAPPPVVRFTSAQETGLTVTAFLQVRRYGDHLRVRHEFYKRLLTRYEREGIAVARQPWAAAEAGKTPAGAGPYGSV